ncbi:hypothetical protein EYF80_039692 [Liparis tanakae]|uniref:Uncharacterized protein n=1 Tax=Liparis tanakae TaxID=230148 RepID=A0A4Z2G962_9TELE|nr:hypothetical protein EYF80_039692 [Liparis tanakae]
MKSSRKLFPFLKAPATDSTTTFLSLTSGANRTRAKASVSKPKECSSLHTVTIWIGPGLLAILKRSNSVSPGSTRYWYWWDWRVEPPLVGLFHGHTGPRSATAPRREMSFTGSLLSDESSIAMKIRLLKEYGGLDEAGGRGRAGTEDSS